jgi:type I restriction enzyme, R subunit
MDPRLLYESPFTDLDPLGVAGIFAEGEVVELIQILRDVQGRAAHEPLGVDSRAINRAWN